LLLRIQPDEGISLRFASKVPGPNVNVQDVRMDFDYEQAFGDEIADAYQRLLLDAMLGDSTLFARRDEVEEAWRIVDSIVAGWRDLPPPLPYPAGSWGPTEAGDLMHKRRIWRQP
jgi:glucose-6-phosphate 1-dehydrogenase